MAFRQCFFFDTPEVTKIVLPKVLQHCPKELNQKGFPRYTKPDETKGPLFIFLELYDRMDRTKAASHFFGIVRLFFKKNQLL